MKTIRVNEAGGPEVLLPEELPVPLPGPGEALVRLDACGVNFIDIYIRSGQYESAMPLTLGQEGAGVVEAIGEGSLDVDRGDRIAYAGTPGSYAEYALVPASRLVRLPDGVDTRTAAAVMLQGMTAHYLAHSTYQLDQGDAALVHAAGHRQLPVLGLGRLRQ